MRNWTIWCTAVTLVAGTLIGCGASNAVTVKAYETTPQAVSALKRSEVDAVVGDLPVMAYIARESAGVLKVAGQQFDVSAFGIATPKSAEPLKRALSAALRNLMADGAYSTILRSWALSAAAVDSPSAPPGLPSAESVPQLADGTLTVGMDIAFPPMEFRDEAGEVVGLDVELARAMASQLGVEVEFKQIEFDKLLSAVANSEVDVAISAITVNDERSLLVDFVDYLMIGSGVLLRKDTELQFVRPHHLCGRSVAVQTGTVQQARLTTLACER